MHVALHIHDNPCYTLPRCGSIKSQLFMESGAGIEARCGETKGPRNKSKGKGRNERRKNLQVTVEFHCSLVSSKPAIIRAAISFSPLSHQLLPPAWPNPVMMLGPCSDTSSLPVTIVTISPRCPSNCYAEYRDQEKKLKNSSNASCTLLLPM